MDFKDSIYWQIYGDIWSFHKNYADVQTDDSYWDSVVSECGSICKKYMGKPENEFAKSLVLNVVDELERIYRRDRNEKK